MTYNQVNLGEVCDFQNGFAFKSSLFKESGKPILRISNIQNQKIDDHKIVYFDPKDYGTDLTRYEVMPNDLLIAMSGATTGKVGFNKTKNIFYLNQRVGNLKPKSVLNKSYLYYLLLTKVEENLRISKGAAQPNLSSEQIKNISFHLPPLEKQKHIVAKLDAAFAEIDQSVEIQKLKSKELSCLEEKLVEEVFRKYKNQLEVHQLKNLCSKITDGVHKKPKYINQGVPFLKINNLTKGEGISLENLSYISQKDHEEFIKRCHPEKDDILITKDGTIGVVRKIDIDLEFSIFVSLALIKPLNKNQSDYLTYVLKSSYCQRQLKPSGTALKHIYLKDLRTLSVPIGSVKINKLIVTKLDEIQKLITISNASVEKSLKALNVLKSIILVDTLKCESA